MDNLVPILTDGLIEVCRTQPEDPTDALAEYLFKRSLDVPYPDPCSYIEWGMPRLSETTKDVISCEKLRGGANNL